MAMPMRTRDLIKMYVSDLDVGDVFSIDDIMAWFKERWPRYTPGSNEIGCNVRCHMRNVAIIGNGIYKVIA